MLPKPLNFPLQLRPSPPPSCWDVRSNEGHDVVHLKPLGTWPLRILRYSNTSRVSRFQHGISPSQTEIRETNQQLQSWLGNTNHGTTNSFSSQIFVRTWKFAVPADSSVSLAHPQVLPGACRGTPSATPDLTVTRHLEMEPGSLSGPVQLESLRFKKDDITKNYVKQYKYGWKWAKCHAAFPQCKTRLEKSMPKSFLLVSPNVSAAPIDPSKGKTHQFSYRSGRQG